MTFRSPRVAADVALLVLLAPIAWAALAFLLMIPLTLIMTILGTDDARPFVWLAGVIALAVLALGARLRLFWTITLEDAGVAAGRWWPRRVSYSRIVYLAAGAATDPMAAVGKAQPGVVPLVFGTGLFAQRRIFLRRAEADRCLRMLHARCENAGAVDTRGNVFPARNPGAPAAAAYRLAETLAIRGVIALVVVAVAIAALFLPNDLAGWHVRLTILPAVPALLVYGGACLRRMRRVLTREAPDRVK